MLLLNIFLIVLAGLLLGLGIAALGFALYPRPFRPHPAPSARGSPAPFRPGLPEQVRRHFAETIGEMPEQVRSAVVWGRGKYLIRGVWIPLRFKAWYRPGEAFYRRMELTFFRRPVLRGAEGYLRGKGTFALGGRIEGGEEVDRSEHLALWAEAVWTPPVFVHHPEIRWESDGGSAARLIVPFSGGVNSLHVYFDPHTGRMTHFESLCRSADSDEPEPWRVDILAWRQEHGWLIPGEIAVGRGAAGSPVFYMSVDGAAYNVHVEDYLGDGGPANAKFVL